MKFSEMPYTRPDLEKIQKDSAAILERITNAQSAQEQIDAYLAYEEMSKEVGTNCSIAYVRHTIDTRDEFYEKESDYLDEIYPALQELNQKIDRALLQSRFRPQLEERFGTLLFKNMEISVRCMKPEIMELMQEENKLTSEYQKLYASATVEWQGETLPLPKLGPFMQDPDRAVRKAAYEVRGQWFEDHREQLDELYDKLVKNRDAQGKAMGYENFIPLGYDRLGRNCWGPKECAAFRDQIAKDLVPIVARVKEDQAKRIGVDQMKIYDDALMFPDGNAKPQGTPDEILAAGREMYHALSPETKEFIDFLYDGELLDVLSKEGKAPGGYCTDFAAYKAPFIFSNFNGTSGDVDVDAGLEVGQLSVRTVSGDVQFRDASCQELIFHSASGDLDLEGACAGLRAETMSGDIALRGQAETAVLKTASGDIELSGLVRRFYGHTLSGDVQVESSQLPEAMELSSKSGDCEAHLPDAGPFTLRYKTVSGDMRFAFPFQYGGGGAIYGDGSGPAYSMTSVSGDLILERY